MSVVLENLAYTSMSLLYSLWLRVTANLTLRGTIAKRSFIRLTGVSLESNFIDLPIVLIVIFCRIYYVLLKLNVLLIFLSAAAAAALVVM